jgi:hypothetical protein
VNSDPQYHALCRLNAVRSGIYSRRIVRAEVAEEVKVHRPDARGWRATQTEALLGASRFLTSLVTSVAGIAAHDSVVYLPAGTGTLGLSTLTGLFGLPILGLLGVALSPAEVFILGLSTP